MVAKLDIHGVHFELDDNIKKYLTKKINRLERYVASENRGSLHAEFYLKESKSKQGKLWRTYRRATGRGSPCSRPPT